MMKHTRAIAMLMTATMIMISLVGCATENKEASNTNAKEDGTAKEESLESTAKKMLNSHGSEEGKEETVYIIGDVNGNAKKQIVSAWLKNPDEKNEIKDVSNLKDIENVEGDETYREGSNDELIWDAKGNDIYYQGTTDGQLPITTKIDYELDGKKVDANDLTGATGHLKITFSYENNTKATRIVNGKNVTMYQPFTVISGMALDNEKATKVTVSNGKVIEAEGKTLVFGMAMPGLKESLGLNNASVDIDIPEKVEMEMDIKDFSLLTSITVFGNSALSELDLDDTNSVEDLKASIKDLNEASGKLENGTSELYDGVGKLKSGADSLARGMTQIDSGAKQLADGLSKLKAKNDELNSGASALSGGLEKMQESMKNTDGITSLVQGSAQVKTGISGSKDAANSLKELLTAMSQADPSNPQLQGALAYATGLSDGLTGLDSSYSQIDTGIKSVASSMGDISTGVDQLAIGASQLSDGIASYTAGVGTAADAATTLSEGTSKANSGVTSLSQGSSQLSSGAKELMNGMTKFNKEGIEKLTNMVEDDLVGVVDRIKELQKYANEYTSYSGTADNETSSVRFIMRTEGI